MIRCGYRCLKPDGAQCEHDADHEGPHRNGLLVWHDPPIVFVGGEPVQPLTRAEVDRLEQIGTAAPISAIQEEAL